MAQSVLTTSQKLALNFAFERLFRLCGLGENSVGFDVGSQLDALDGGVVDHLIGNAVDGPFAVGAYVDNIHTLGTGGALLLSVRNNGLEKAAIGYDGSLGIAGNFTLVGGITITGSNSIIENNSNQTLGIYGGKADGASSIAIALSSLNTLTTTAKILSIQNNTVEKAYFATDGSLILNAGTATLSAGQISGSNITSSVGSGYALGGNGVMFDAGGNTKLQLRGYATDGSSAVAVTLNNNQGLGTAGAKLVSIQNFGTEKIFIDKDGKIAPSYGDVTGANANAGGNATSNTAIGRAAIASGASSCVITNSLVTTTSIVLLQLEATGVGVDSLSVSVGSGSFTVTSLAGLGVTTTVSAKAKFSWSVLGA